METVIQALEKMGRATYREVAARLDIEPVEALNMLREQRDDDVEAAKNLALAEIALTALTALQLLTGSERAGLQEYRKATQPLSDPERQELIKLRNEDALHQQQWAQSMMHDQTLGGILPKL